MFDKKDLIHIKNLIKMLAKAKMELEGQEVLAAADVIRWVAMLESKINDQLIKAEQASVIRSGAESIVTVEEKVNKPKKAKKEDKTKGE